MHLRARQRLGKYRIDRKLGSGGYANVYQATDTLQGRRVALKVSDAEGGSVEEQFHEVRLLAKLEHPNILRLLNAEVIDGRLVLVFPLGLQSLAERMQRRRSVSVVMGYAEQMLAALAYAHDRHVQHRDIKPENFILFPDGVVMLSDFGISKRAFRTVSASGSGTIGYIAPEQAMGKPSFQSDVFSIGLVLYELFTTHLPEWPFEWPPEKFDRLRKSVHPNLIAVIQRAIHPDPRKRYRNAREMLSAFESAREGAEKGRAGVRSATSRGGDRGLANRRGRDHGDYLREFGDVLRTDYRCAKCEGPVSETMAYCPWCRAERTGTRVHTRLPQYCPRCRRGMKLDWTYCAWCHGPGFEPPTRRKYPDRHYSGRCTNPRCERKLLMPFMRYCPWCRKKVEKKWGLGHSRARCRSCGWGIAKEYWSYCAWCSSEVANR